MGAHSHATLRRFVGRLVVVASLSHAGAAYAQSSERGVAQSLFEEGVRLMREKRYAEACPKLAESHKIDPAGGTVFNLALCLEEDGKLASAYVAYDEALARAKKDGNKQRTQIVEGRMAALRPRLSRVTVTVAKAEAGSKPDVRFDGTPLSEQAWGVPFYADVGTHTITAEAPGYKPFRSELRVEAAGKQHEVSVPALEKEPSAAAPATAPRPDADTARDREKEKADGSKSETYAVQVSPPSRGALPWILVGTGAVLLGTGAVTGVLAFARHDDSNRECPDGRCTAQGVQYEDQANTFGWVANVTIPLGVLAGAAGAYLFLKDPTPRASTARAGARIAPTSSGLVLYGAF